MIKITVLNVTILNKNCYEYIEIFISKEKINLRKEDHSCIKDKLHTHVIQRLIVENNYFVKKNIRKRHAQYNGTCKNVHDVINYIKLILMMSIKNDFFLVQINCIKFIFCCCYINLGIVQFIQVDEDNERSLKRFLFKNYILSVIWISNNDMEVRSNVS
ncbi:hypothetical protein V1478_003433 [Vespula squamosa]|uniref:Uncharacterized protein n=1 Tax=Vespula squamosa TaxID=30214 RepID=A0ABD2BM98_VESSQ